MNRRDDTAPRKVLLAVTIDTECDKGPDWRTRFPLRYRSVTEAIPGRLMPLFRRHGVVPTFLLSPEIIRDEACVETLSAIGDCELGTHLHGEFIEPEADFDAPATSTPQNAYRPEVERAKLRNLTELFRTRFGAPPRSFRGGRFALSRGTLSALEDLGYLVDTTVTPFRANVYENGLRCDYWGAPWTPYHPSASDPRRPGTLRLWEVPVTILVPALAAWPRFLLRGIGERLMRRRRAFSALGADMRNRWIRPFRGSPEELMEGADAVVARTPPGAPAVVNVMFHSVEAIPEASPYAQTESDVESLLGSLGALFEHMARRYRLASVRLSDLPAQYTA
jgi:hypothetical protein